MSKYSEIAQYLLDNAVYPAVFGWKDDTSVLHCLLIRCAINRGNLPILKVLVSANLENMLEINKHALLVSVKAEDLEAVKLLCQ